MKVRLVHKGGRGSGHFDHAGRPGKHGGSLPGKRSSSSGGGGGGGSAPKPQPPKPKPRRPSWMAGEGKDWDLVNSFKFGRGYTDIKVGDEVGIDPNSGYGDSDSAEYTVQAIRKMRESGYLEVKLHGKLWIPADVIYPAFRFT